MSQSRDSPASRREEKAQLSELRLRYKRQAASTKDHVLEVQRLLEVESKQNDRIQELETKLDDAQRQSALVSGGDVPMQDCEQDMLSCDRTELAPAAMGSLSVDRRAISAFSNEQQDKMAETAISTAEPDPKLRAWIKKLQDALELQKVSNKGLEAKVADYEASIEERAAAHKKSIEMLEERITKQEEDIVVRETAYGEVYDEYERVLDLYSACQRRTKALEKELRPDQIQRVDAFLESADEPSVFQPPATRVSS